MTETDKKEIKKFIKDQADDFGRQVGALSEHFQHQTSAVAEHFLDLKKDVTSLKVDVTGLKKDMTEVKQTLSSHGQILESHTEMIGKLMTDVTEIKDGLKQKVGVKDLKTVESRVKFLEKSF